MICGLPDGEHCFTGGLTENPSLNVYSRDIRIRFAADVSDAIGLKFEFNDRLAKKKHAFVKEKKSESAQNNATTVYKLISSCYSH